MTTGPIQAQPNNTKRVASQDLLGDALNGIVGIPGAISNGFNDAAKNLFGNLKQLAPSACILCDTILDVDGGIEVLVPTDNNISVPITVKVPTSNTINVP